MKRLASALFLAAICGTAGPVMAQQDGAPVITSPNYETRISSIEDQMRALNGQVEQLGYAIRRLDQATQRMQADYDARLGRLETSSTSLQAAVDNLNATAATNATAGNIGALHTTPDGHVVGMSANTPVTAAAANTSDPADPVLTSQEQYDHAFSLLRQANYEEAEKSFRAFIDKNPKDKLIDNAKYWMAETLYVRGRFTDAAIAFGDAFQTNPNGSKAPDSLLKLAMSLAATEKKPDACVALGELKKYPNASASVKSRGNEEFVKLKCVTP